MIKAEELRIGNKFIGIAGIQTVFDISDNTNRGKLEYVDENHRLMYSHLITVEENRNQYKPCEMEPIPLTPAILEKWGFEQYQISCYRYAEIYIYYNNSRNLYMFRDFPVRIKYLHQLQNLFYCLSGKELKMPPLT